MKSRGNQVTNTIVTKKLHNIENMSFNCRYLCAWQNNKN